MTLLRSGASASGRGPSEWFTGEVFVDDLAGIGSAYLRMNRVTFTPGARTAWHTHSHGQVLHAVAGIGRVQTDEDPIEELRTGDTFVIAPGQRHWHDADPDHVFVHLSVVPADPDADSGTTWMEHVTEADYRQQTRSD